jgi:hypothetical protein
MEGNIINKRALPKYASSCSLLRLVGKTVGIPGIKVFSFSSPPHRDLLFFALLSSLSAVQMMEYHESQLLIRKRTRNAINPKETGYGSVDWIHVA